MNKHDLTTKRSCLTKKGPPFLGDPQNIH